MSPVASVHAVSYRPTESVPETLVRPISSGANSSISSFLTSQPEDFTTFFLGSPKKALTLRQDESASSSLNFPGRAQNWMRYRGNFFMIKSGSIPFTTMDSALCARSGPGAAVDPATLKSRRASLQRRIHRSEGNAAAFYHKE